MMHKAAIAVLLLIAVSYTAGASTCAPGPCCECPATISLTSTQRTAEACCASVSTLQGSIVSARPGKTDGQGGADPTPDLKGILFSDSTHPLARALGRASLQRVVALTETGQSLYLHTGRLRL